MNNALTALRALAVPGAAIAILAGCASVPETITTPVAGPGIAEVRAEPDAHVGAKLRWGGSISQVTNLEDRTEITVVARPITHRGEPQGEQESTGRFLVIIDRFLDPEEYESGRRITVVGSISGQRAEKIGEYVYHYPVVQASDVYLWQEYVHREPRYYRWPYYWGSPFWGPYYHPYRWPYRHYHGF